MNDLFKFYIALEKSAHDEDTLTGVASGIELDRDEERMAETAVDDMERDINAIGVNLFSNHKHDWEETMGVVTAARKNASKLLDVKLNLDDPVTNPKVPLLKNKMRRGIKIGLSVGGAVTAEHLEYNKALGKKVKVIDHVKLYEISLVGIQSYPDALLSMSSAIAKSRKEKGLYNNQCKLCFTKKALGACPVCFYPE